MSSATHSSITILYAALLSFCLIFFFFFFNDTATTEIYTLSLHDALPICSHRSARNFTFPQKTLSPLPHPPRSEWIDRKSTRLNSSHSQISYAVFCLKKKKTTHYSAPRLTSTTSETDMMTLSPLLFTAITL